MINQASSGTSILATPAKVAGVGHPPLQCTCTSLLAPRLAVALQVLVEPGDEPGQRINVVFAFGPTVAFVRIVMSVNGLPFLLEDLLDLTRFLGGDANVALALQDQQRRLFAPNVFNGRGGLVGADVFRRVAEQPLF